MTETEPTVKPVQTFQPGDSIVTKADGIHLVVHAIQPDGSLICLGRAGAILPQDVEHA